MRDSEPQADPTRFLDGWRAPVKAPDEAPLVTGLASLTPSLSAERLQRLRDRGYAMQDVQDVELPASPPLSLRMQGSTALPRSRRTSSPGQSS
jgi:hypothetical protein